MVFSCDMSFKKNKIKIPDLSLPSGQDETVEKCKNKTCDECGVLLMKCFFNIKSASI
jgi:hypothetical protein